MKTIFEKLQTYGKAMKFHPPISDETAKAWAERIPAPLMQLYHLFNGGEIFIPGTTIFGLTGGKDDIIRLNASEVRSCLSVPESYLIFAELNFGDYICINTEEPYDLVQWDHETDEPYNDWDSLEEWLEETIEDFEIGSGGTY